MRAAVTAISADSRSAARRFQTQLRDLLVRLGDYPKVGVERPQIIGPPYRFAVIHDPNARQWVITSYLLGFGVAQLVYGSLADRYGRKPVLMVGLTLYTLFAALCAFSTSFEMLLIARFLTGLGAASTRVLAVSIVRDCYAGRQMARVMSLAFIVFLATPVIAPSLGQAIMLFASWRWIFGILSIFGLVVIAWAAIKLPETQHPEDRLPISVAGVTSAFKIALTDRIAMGYTLAAALVLSGLFGFLNSAQQVFVDVLGAGDIFPLIFAGIAGTMTRPASRSRVSSSSSGMTYRSTCPRWRRSVSAAAAIWK